MKIHLEQAEIEIALERYVRSKVKLNNQSLVIEFTAGRNPPTISADIDIVDSTDEVGDMAEEAPPEDEGKPFSDEQQEIPFGNETASFLADSESFLE